MSSRHSHNSPTTLTEEPEGHLDESRRDEPEEPTESQRGEPEKSAKPQREEPGEPTDSQRDEPDERQRPPSPEPPASPSTSQAPGDQPPQTPLKDRDSEGRLTGNPTLLTDSPTAYTTPLREPTPPRVSQVLDFNTTTHTTLTAAAEMITGNANQPMMTNAGPPVNQPTPTGNNTNPNARGSTSNATNMNTPAVRYNTATTPNMPGNIVTTVYYHPDRSQTMLSSRPLSPGRQTGLGPGMYDPIRGDNGTQVYTPVTNGNGNGGDPVGAPVRRGSRDTLGRNGAPRPRPVFNNPADGNFVGSGNGYGYGPGPGSRRASRIVSGQDWLPDIPEPMSPREKTVEERLRPTINSATTERDKYRKQARQQGLLINGAIGLQIAVGAITTGVAAAASSGGNIGAAVASLGAISTILASYLAKVRGSGEPEFSTIHARELDTYLRDIDAFIMDHGHKIGTEQDDKILMYRDRFELLIKTEGEDSSGGTSGHPHRSYPSSPHPPPPPVSVPPHVLSTGMPGGYDDKHMWRNDKGGMV